MIDKTGVAALLSPSTLTGTSSLGKKTTLATITKDLLNAKYNPENPPESTQFSQELRSFITENLKPEQAKSLLSALDALDGIENTTEQGDLATQQLLGNLQGNILNLLV